MSAKVPLPSLRALRVFETVARLASFTRAAEELGITQGAVSLQVRQLEDELGMPLIRRMHRSIAPTAEGAVLARVLREGFESFAEAIAALRPRRDGGELTVATTVAFAHFWLMPRLAAFRAAAGDVGLRIVSRDQLVDFEAEAVDLSIFYGDGDFRGLRAELLWREAVFPVATPEIAARVGPDPSLEELLGLPLIAVEAPEKTWIDWDPWLAAQGGAERPRQVRLRFNHYTDALYSALAGEGVVLGWHRLIGDVLAQGRLVRIGTRVVSPPGGYHILTPSRSPLRREATVFLDWLRTAAAAPPAG